MKTKWDYTELAEAYLKRPAYAESVIEEIVSIAGVSAGDPVCDVGAGVAHLTIPLAKAGFTVTAVEPNDAMRELGKKQTTEMQNVTWYEGTGEETGQSDNEFAFVTFGSSFNVTDRQQALKETHRILKPQGWFACMWNHRDLDDPIQSAIEATISEYIADYSYGSRREDQTEVINSSGIFQNLQSLEGSVLHTQSAEDCIEAWRSHATLERQAGEKFHQIVDAIEDLLQSKGLKSIEIPYTTRCWIAQAA